MIPTAKRGGRKRTVDVREFLNALFCVLATACQLTTLAKDMPPKSTPHAYFMLWDWNATLERIRDALYVAMRKAIGKEPDPTTAIIDSQSAKAAQKGARQLIRRISTLARRSRAANVVSLSKRSGPCST